MRRESKVIPAAPFAAAAPVVFPVDVPLAALPVGTETIDEEDFELPGLLTPPAGDDAAGLDAPAGTDEEPGAVAGGVELPLVAGGALLVEFTLVPFAGAGTACDGSTRLPIPQGIGGSPGLGLGWSAFAGGVVLPSAAAIVKRVVQ